MKSRRKHFKNKYVTLWVVCAWLAVGCENFVEIDPPITEVTTEVVFEDETTLNSAVNGMYSQMVENDNNLFNTALEVFTGTSSDEFTNYSSSQDNIEFNSNAISPSNGINNNSFWRFGYRLINHANAIIVGVTESGLSGDIATQGLGEAYFVRAFAHFYLTNLYGDIPYVETTSVETTNNIGKVSQDEVLQNVIDDLILAKELLREDYSINEDDRRIRPNRGAASAFLSRAYLYTQQWSMAEAEATEVIGNSLYALDSAVIDVFLPESAEAIWQLFPNNPSGSTTHGRIFVIKFGVGIAFWTTAFANDFTSTFDPADERLADWVGDFGGQFDYPNKYKLGFGDTTPEPAEYVVVFRLAEQYLIRAEAKAQQGNIVGAQEDINVIRTRAGLPNTTASDLNTLMDAIILERRHELFAEWGHRWFDLKRTGRASSVLSVREDKDWQDTDVLWPLPEEELLRNPNLLPQNAGY